MLKCDFAYQWNLFSAFTGSPLPQHVLLQPQLSPAIDCWKHGVYMWNGQAGVWVGHQEWVFTGPCNQRVSITQGCLCVFRHVLSQCCMHSVARLTSCRPTSWLPVRQQHTAVSWKVFTSFVPLTGTQHLQNTTLTLTFFVKPSFYQPFKKVYSFFQL